jgi:hypothetical protein
MDAQKNGVVKIVAITSMGGESPFLANSPIENFNCTQISTWQLYK